MREFAGNICKIWSAEDRQSGILPENLQGGYVKKHRKIPPDAERAASEGEKRVQFFVWMARFSAWRAASRMVSVTVG